MTNKEFTNSLQTYNSHFVDSYSVFISLKYLMYYYIHRLSFQGWLGEKNNDHVDHVRVCVERTRVCELQNTIEKKHSNVLDIKTFQRFLDDIYHYKYKMSKHWKRLEIPQKVTATKV